MRIAVLTSSYPRFAGDGAAPFVQSLSRSLAKQGHDVVVIAPYDVAVMPATEPARLTVKRFRYVLPLRWHIMGHARSLENDAQLRPLAVLLTPLFVLFSLITLLRVIRQRRSDVIHVHWVVPNGLVAALASIVTGVPYVLSLHGSDIFVALRNPLIGAAAGWVLRRASAVTACSPELRDAALKLGATTPPRLLAWGADPDLFRPAEQSGAAHEADGGQEVITFAALGRLVGKKGFGRLLDAWPAVVARCPKARLVIGGEGPLQSTLEEQIRDLGIGSSVRLAGRVPWDDVPTFLAAADVFVLPSERDTKGNLDGLPTVLLEAMACGAAVVASDIGGVALAVENGQNGVLVPPGDSAWLAETLAALAADPERRQKLGRAARHTVIDRLNWDAVTGVLANDLATAAQSAQRSQRMARQGNTPVPPEAYNREYYLTYMEGADTFAQFSGGELPRRLAYPLDLVRQGAGQRILDLGCGRGEAGWQCAARGSDAVGVDYSPDAMAIGRELPAPSAGSLRFVQASADRLPFEDASFNAVLMLDIVEHLYPAQLLRAFQEARRLLKPGGRLVVHTMPNADYYRFGYPVYRALMRLAGKNLPSDPRLRWYRGETHVNIQNPRGLRRMLRRAGFTRVDVWLEPVTDGGIRRMVSGMWPARPVLCNDIFAIAEMK